MAHKKAALNSQGGFLLIVSVDIYDDKPFTNFVNFDLLLDALFLCMTFFLAKRSSIETTRGNSALASSELVVLLNFLIALRVVFAW